MERLTAHGKSRQDVQQSQQDEYIEPDHRASRGGKAGQHPQDKIHQNGEQCAFPDGGDQGPGGGGRQIGSVQNQAVHPLTSSVVSSGTRAIACFRRRSSSGVTSWSPSRLNSRRSRELPKKR